MDDKELAEFKDSILRLILDKKFGADTSWLFHQFDIEGLTTSFLERVLDEINNWDRDILQLTKDKQYTHLVRTPLTKKFLDNGGFVKQYESDLEADLETEKLNRQTQRIKDLEERKLSRYWIPIVISIVSTLVAVASLIKTSNSVSQSELKTIQDNIDSLKSDFKKENDKLKSRIYEAEMLIAVYDDSIN